jgi:hypothetical protein
MPQEALAHGTIEVRVEDIALLFDPLDPFPLPSRDLARSVEAFILDWARELPQEAPCRIVVHVPGVQAERPEAAQLKEAIAAHFSKSAESVTRDLRELFRIGRTSLLIGLAALAACIFGASVASTMITGASGQIVSEGLIIVGWVANWRPIEIFLYDWWPLAQQRRLRQRIAAAAVEIRPFA